LPSEDVAIPEAAPAEGDIPVNRAKAAVLPTKFLRDKGVMLSASSFVCLSWKRSVYVCFPLLNEFWENPNAVCRFATSMERQKMECRIFMVIIMCCSDLSMAFLTDICFRVKSISNVNTLSELRYNYWYPILHFLESDHLVTMPTKLRRIYFDDDENDDDSLKFAHKINRHDLYGTAENIDDDEFIRDLLHSIDSFDSDSTLMMTLNFF
jgi:hypothetical protein